MASKLRTLGRILTGVAILIIIAIICFFLYHASKKGIESPTQKLIETKASREHEVFVRRHFNLVSPNEAPNDLRNLAKRGFEIMVNTQKYAKEYVGSKKMTCTNCHFAGGDTTGGAQGSISLAGVAAKYPTYQKSLKKVIDLSERINNCFCRSLNGKAVPLNHDIMLALITYLHWISRDIPIYRPVPWLGLKYLSIEGPGDPAKGKKIYHKYCALCHREDGQGSENNPPLWGPESYNDAAGMHVPEKMAAFIYWNMPFLDSTPVLTEQEAWDVTSYIHSQPRPKYDERNAILY